MLFYCVWPDDVSLLCDAESKAKAIEIATEHVGRAPGKVKPIPVNVFACDVEFVDDEDDAPDAVLLTPLEHVELLLEKFEDECTPDGAATCTSEADDAEGNMVRCELAPHGEDTPHAGAGLVW